MIKWRDIQKGEKPDGRMVIISDGDPESRTMGSWDGRSFRETYPDVGMGPFYRYWIYFEDLPKEENDNG